jgi:hypothetical protein
MEEDGAVKLTDKEGTKGRIILGIIRLEAHKVIQSQTPQGLNHKTILCGFMQGKFVRIDGLG